MPQGISQSAFGIPQGVQAITVPGEDQRGFHDIRAFTGANTADVVQVAGRGLEIAQSGTYSADLQVSIELTTATAGEWGVSLLLAAHDGASETLVDSWVLSEHTDALTGVDEDFMLNVVSPPIHVLMGQYFYAAVSFGADAGSVLNFNLSAQPDPGELTIRRYTPFVAGLTGPRAPTDILSVASAKLDLRIEADETGHDTLLAEQIAVAVDWVGKTIDAPLLPTAETLLVEVPAGGDTPMRVRATHLQSVGLLRYWTDRAGFAGAPDGSLDLASAQRIRPNGSPFVYFEPPGGRWPDMAARRIPWSRHGRPVGLALLDVHRGLDVSDAVNPALRQAVMLLVRKLYDGIEPMSTPALDRLLAPYLSSVPG